MQKRHTDKKQYFEEQVYTTEKYVIPFLERTLPIEKGMRVLEIGCGEAGNLKPFLDRGCICYGLDINAYRIGLGKEFFVQHPNRGMLHLEVRNIYDKTDVEEKYDIIFLRDVIEHIHDQEKFMKFLKNFMHEKTIVFFAFPPWQNPFGGHQQTCKSKILSHFPFIHLLPKKVYHFLLKLVGENEVKINDMLEVKETGISIERFEKCLKKADLKILEKELYFINPNYEVKFGLKPRKIVRIFRVIPYFRNFITTCLYCTVSKFPVN